MMFYEKILFKKIKLLKFEDLNDGYKFDVDINNGELIFSYIVRFKDNMIHKSLNYFLFEKLPVDDVNYIEMVENEFIITIDYDNLSGKLKDNKNLSLFFASKYFKMVFYNLRIMSDLVKNKILKFK
jgi:hypothetical protein